MKECSRDEVLEGKVSQNDPSPTHPGGQIDQVNTKIKDMGLSYMIREKVINQP